MKIGLQYKICLLLLWMTVGYAQEQSGFYVPYQMPSHAFVRFNTFVANPAFPLIVNYQEHNVGLYYRNQWTGYDSGDFSLMGVSYGRNFRENNTINAFVFKRNIPVMTNYGVVLNYGHLVELSDQVKLNMGLNVIPSFSGVDKGRVRAADPSDPLLNAGNTFGFALQPGIDITIGNFHFGGTADNLIDYASGANKAMTAFRDKTFTAHLMYRAPFDSRSDLLEEGYWSVFARATKEYDGFNFGGGALVDLPALGWANVGYTQRNGLLAGVGFNLRQQWSLGIEYENPIGVKIPQLGSTFGVYLNVQFGGKRQERTPPKPSGPKHPTIEPVKPPEPEPVTPIKPVDTLIKPRPTQVPIAVRPMNMQGVDAGYYVIIGVYANPRNAFNYRRDMSQRYEVGSFVNKEKQLTYVYLGKGKMTLEEAQALMRKYMTHRDFIGGIWVLEVINK